MKTIKILLIAFASLSLNATAQNCKYEKNDVDKFTGKMTKLTNATRFYESKKSIGFIKVQRTGDEYIINFVCDGSFNVRKVIKDGSELSFLLENDKIITLKKSDGNNYVISKDDLMLLMKEKIKSVRVQYLSKNEETVTEDVEIKKGDGIRVQELVKCVM